VVVGDAEDVPSSMVVVETFELVVVPVQVTFPRLLLYIPTNNRLRGSLIPGPWTRVTCDRRVTWRVLPLNSVLSLPLHEPRRIHMPPRRSTRSSARLSAEPEGNPPSHKPTLSSKRKRSSGDNADTEGQEDTGRPPSRTTRRSSSKATPSVPASRASSRQKSISHQEQDSDAEDGHEEPPHPTKRSRPSYELEGVHEEDEEEDTKPVIAPRTRRATSRLVAPSSANGKIGKEQVAAAEDETEEQVTAKPTSRTHSTRKRSSSSKPSTSGRNGRPSRSVAVSIKAEPLDEPTLENTDDVDGGEIEAPATSQRKTAKRSSRKVKSPSLSRSVGNEDSGDDTGVGENATATVPNGVEGPDLLAEQSTPVPSPKKLPSTTPPVHEEEKSLLDDLPTSPSKAKRVPPPLEEPQGPRPRLVIHKLVLVNFKSYAGCQEIGPFHKVGYFRVATPRLIICSLSPQ